MIYIFCEYYVWEINIKLLIEEGGRYCRRYIYVYSSSDILNVYVVFVLNLL